MDDLDSMILKYQNKQLEIGGFSGTDLVPYVEFIVHYKAITGWQSLNNGAETPLMKLLMIDSLFFNRKIISITKSEITDIIAK